MKTRIILLIVFTYLVSCNKDGTTNPTPNNSNEVSIGTQVWMEKNLDVDHYRNGDLIPEIKDYNDWVKLTTGGWCYYDNDSANGVVYGKLYNWYAVNDPRGLAPEGWHIPSDVEWRTLIDYLGGADVAGGKMKETGTSHWQNPNSGATNESGFSALPGGYRFNINGDFESINVYGIWWSSRLRGWFYCLTKDSPRIDWDLDSIQYGFSVRCIKD